MPKLKTLFFSYLALVPGLLAPVAFAEDERWYQVELLIFSHESGASDEQWEPLPQLAYPDAGRFLVYPQQVSARAEEHEGTSEVDEFGRQFLRPHPDEQVDTTETATNIPQRDTQQPPAGTPPGTITEPAANDLDPPAPVTPTPFIALPRSSAEFYGKAAYMQRSGNYSTLFHETWVQPVATEAEALSLIIDRSGDSGAWPALQGSVKLHISRFLHLETNLWLNTTGDYLPGEWQMPAPPLGPPSVVVEEPEPAIEEGLPLATELVAGPADDDLLPDEEALPEDTGPTYPWRHAVLMQQTRKMRSNEVHYIDHPLLGVVIKLMPLDEEQLQAMAEAELAGETTAPQ